MKRFLAMLLGAALSLGARAQVSVTATSGTTGPSNYATLSLAFAAINSGTHAGAIDIAITADVTESSSATLLASAAPSSYTSVSIRPSGGAARTISGTLGSALIDLNGADNVTIDGLNTGGNSLTISNKSTANTANVSTVRMVNGATGNLVTNCTLLGSFSGNVSSNAGGTVLIATGSSSSGGNNNNTVTNNNIGPAGSNLPTKAVNGNGSSSAINTGNIISNNKIYDFFGAGVTHSGIYLNGSNSGWTISGNRFYQTATRTITSGIQASAIWIIGSSSGYTITNNIIGYSSAAGTGTYTYGGSTASADFIPVYLQVGDGTSTFSGNTITAMSASAGFGGTGSSGPLKILFVTTSASNADLVISDNIIGSITNAGAIALATTSSSSMDVFGIYLNAIKTATLSNNKIGGISLSIPGNATTKIIAIDLNSTGGTFTCQGNTIGGTAVNSFNNTSTATSSQTIGILSTGGGTFSGNTISNLSGNGNSGTSSIISGIYYTGNAAATITQNTISGIAHMGTSGTGSIVSAIHIDAGTNVHVSRNKIYNISSAAAQTSTVSVNGIYASGGTTLNIANNVIGDIKAPVANVADAVRGITLASSTSSTAVNVYFNSIYLSGTSSAATFGSAAIFHRASSTAATNALSLRNNILVNLSTAKGTGVSAVLRRSASGQEANYLDASNNNLLYAGTPGAANLLYFDGTNSDQTLGDFKVRVSPREAASFTGSPNFISTTASAGNFLRINTTEPTSIERGGAAIANFTVDYDGDTRNATTPDIGADEFNGTACAVSISGAPTYCLSAGPTLTSSSGTSFNQWNFNGSAIGGATNVTYQPLAAGSYTVSIVAPTCFVTSAAAIVFSQSAAPGILNSSATQPVCTGSNVIITQTGGSLGDGAHWQWYRDAAFTDPVGGQLVSGNAQLTVAPTSTTTYYLRAEGGTAPCSDIVAGVASVTITVRAPLAASVAVAQSFQCQPGLAAMLNISGGPAGGSVTVTTNGVNPQTITLDGAGAATFASDPLMANATFSITSVSDGVCSNSVASSVTVYVGALMANPLPNPSVCPGTTVPSITFLGNFPAGTTYSWTSSNPAVGLAQSSGSGLALPSFTATNNGTSIQFTDIAVWPNIAQQGCQVRKMVFRIWVKPAPTVNGIGSQTVCAGAQTTAVSFSGNIAGTVYNWINSNPSIGIAAGGAGDIPAFTATNNSALAGITGTFTVTPNNDGCTGPTSGFTITVNKAAVNFSYPASPYCPTGTAAPRRSSGSTGIYTAGTGIVFNNNSTGEINLAASQPGTYTVTFTVSNTGGGCGGTATASLTILPRATVNIIPNQALCAGATTALVQPTGTAVGFSWVNLNPSAGLAANGTGAIPAFVAVNNTAAPISAQVNVTPLGNGTTVCNGNPVAYRYLVYPRPTVNPVSMPGYCRGVATAPVSFGSATAGTSYSWTNNNVSVGLGASGSAALPSFMASNLLPPGNTNTATITVTPSANKCAGTPYVFQVSVLDCIAQSGSGTSGDNARMASVQVGPNPASSRLTIVLDAATAGSYSVQLLNSQGAPVARPTTFTGNSHSIDISGITPGSYVLKLVNLRTKQSIQKQVIKL
ncbi:MAG: T9SS type A sorting domain-containing protein [Chitinophagaceae bacterium]|nr:MAG: T9SS type A sorting domain-containing protein [Chitinophagaceae bacterium]